MAERDGRLDGGRLAVETYQHLSIPMMERFLVRLILILQYGERLISYSDNSMPGYPWTTPAPCRR